MLHYSMTIAAAALCSVAMASGAYAQEVSRGVSALDLPRPGYEPRTIRVGTTVIAPEVRVQGVYNSNIYATSQNEDDDFIVNISPHVDIDSDFGKLKMHSELNADILEYTQFGSESQASFGANTKLNYGISRSDNFSIGGGYQRTVQSRTDPESNNNPNQPKWKIDILTGNVEYRHSFNRMTLTAQGSAEKMNYLLAQEDDRDQTTYTGSFRADVQVGATANLFGQAYINRRDARLAFDRNGVDRDNTTIGFLAGVKLDLGNVWRGEMGVGVFRANPDSSLLQAFTGFGASGRLTWSPQVRTAITLSVFRGDVATVVAGANGRIDSRIGLRLDQEVRHNLLLTASLGLRQTSYRGSINQDQTSVSGGAEIEYLLNRHISAFVNVNYTKRFADQPLDEFKRFQGGIGLRLRY